MEIKQTQEMLDAPEKEHDKAVAKTNKLLRNLLSGNPQSQWDWICHKMHTHDLWAVVNGEKTIGSYPCL